MRRGMERESVFEANGATSGAVTIAVLVGGAIPGVLGLLWVLSEQEFRPLLTTFRASSHVASIRCLTSAGERTLSRPLTE